MTDFLSKWTPSQLVTFESIARLAGFRAPHLIADFRDETELVKKIYMHGVVAQQVYYVLEIVPIDASTVIAGDALLRAYEPTIYVDTFTTITITASATVPGEIVVRTDSLALTKPATLFEIDLSGISGIGKYHFALYLIT